MLDIIGKRRWFFLMSGLVILAGLISMATPFGRLKMGIEFSSGSLLGISFEQRISQSDLRQELTNLGYPQVLIQGTKGGSFYIRTHKLGEAEKNALEKALEARFGTLNETEFDSVSPLIAEETARNAAIAVVASAIGMLLYITWAFRKMPSPFRYGTCAVLGLVHDILVSLGVFSIVGGFLGWEINLMFITGILALIGYSINNTIVVFDRIRENLLRGVSPDFGVIVNDSIIGTLGRCLNTGVTTLIVVLALFLFVGASIQNFVVVLMIGITAGTYSSMLIAPMLLLVWEKRSPSARVLA